LRLRNRYPAPALLPHACLQAFLPANTIASFFGGKTTSGDLSKVVGSAPLCESSTQACILVQCAADGVAVLEWLLLADWKGLSIVTYLSEVLCCGEHADETNLPPHVHTLCSRLQVRPQDGAVSGEPAHSPQPPRCS
jgi:hypothetical protein